jgi:hypothetical protein
MFLLLLVLVEGTGAVVRGAIIGRLYCKKYGDSHLPDKSTIPDVCAVRFRGASSSGNLEWLVRAAFLEFANVYMIHILWHLRATGVLGGEIRWDRIQYAYSLDIVTWMTPPYATFQGRCIPGIQHVLLQIQTQ